MAKENRRYKDSVFCGDEEMLKNAVRECIRQDILSEYLGRKGREV